MIIMVITYRKTFVLNDQKIPTMTSQYNIIINLKYCLIY